MRLIGIGTPEVYGGLDRGGRRASARLKRLAIGRRRLLTPIPSGGTRDRSRPRAPYAKPPSGPDAAMPKRARGGDPRRALPALAAVRPHLRSAGLIAGR